MYQECRHIFTSGRKCRSPALRDQPFCYFHANHRKRPTPANEPYEPYIEAKDTALNLPPLEDADAIQLALSDIVLALAANRIDPRRARILIYGLQVASQNHRHRTAQAAEQTAAEASVRETHQHEDGTLIGPEKESPDPEEAAKRKRPPSLGEILLRQAEALKAEAEAKRQAQQQAEQESQQQTDPRTKESQDQTVPILLPQVQAKAETHPRRCHPEPSAKRGVEGPPRTKFARCFAEQGPFSSQFRQAK
jgi:hypothetical protein